MRRVLELQDAMGKNLVLDEVAGRGSLRFEGGEFRVSAEGALALGAMLTLLARRWAGGDYSSDGLATLDLFGHRWEVAVTGTAATICGLTWTAVGENVVLVSGDEAGNAFLHHDPFDGEQVRHVAARALGVDLGDAVLPKRWHGYLHAVPSEEVLAGICPQVAEVLRGVRGWSWGGEVELLTGNKFPAVVRTVVLACVLETSTRPSAGISLPPRVVDDLRAVLGARPRPRQLCATPASAADPLLGRIERTEVVRGSADAVREAVGRMGIVVEPALDVAEFRLMRDEEQVGTMEVTSADVAVATVRRRADG